MQMIQAHLDIKFFEEDIFKQVLDQNDHQDILPSKKNQIIFEGHE